jgi:hypothetical protein
VYFFVNETTEADFFFANEQLNTPFNLLLLLLYTSIIMCVMFTYVFVFAEDCLHREMEQIEDFVKASVEAASAVSRRLQKQLSRSQRNHGSDFCSYNETAEAEHHVFLKHLRPVFLYFHLSHVLAICVRYLHGFFLATKYPTLESYESAFWKRLQESQ